MEFGIWNYVLGIPEYPEILSWNSLDMAAAANMAQKIERAIFAYRKALSHIHLSDEEAIMMEDGIPVERLLALAAMEGLPIMSEESAAEARAELVALAGEDVANAEREKSLRQWREMLDEELEYHSKAAVTARSHTCSLPGCTNPAPYMCSKCQSAYYCSEEHQKDDWKRHKPECRALSAKAGGKRRKSRRSKRFKRSNRKTKRRY